jgi:mono/diheme cytochrome c family protein
MSRLPVLALTILGVAFGSAGAQSTDSTSRQKSVLQGVYSDEQATRGDSEHQANCGACHGTENYAGDAFVRTWAGRTAFDLFDQLKTTMPEDNPGGLSAQQYTDIIAYIFKINGLPAGAEPLPADPEALRLIRIEAKSAGAQAALVTPPAARRHAVRGASRRSTSYHPHAPASPSAKR